MTGLRPDENLTLDTFNLRVFGNTFTDLQLLSAVIFNRPLFSALHGRDFPSQTNAADYPWTITCSL